MQPLFFVAFLLVGLFLSPTNIFTPASTPAQSILDLSIFVLEVTAAIFLVVFTLRTYAANDSLAFVELEMKAAGILDFGTDLRNPDFTDCGGSRI
jgi:hypothetical protein